MFDSVAFAQQVPIYDQPLNIFPIEQNQSNMRLQQQLMEPYNNHLEQHYTGSQVQCICIKDSGWDSGFCTIFQNKIPKCIHSFTPSTRNSTKQAKHLLLYYSTGANSRSFHLIFNKRFDHLETFLTINRPKKELLAGSLRQSFAESRDLFYPISIMLQIFNEDSDILQLTENAKIYNNIASYLLVSCHVTSTLPDVPRVCRCPKRTFILPKKYTSVSTMLSQPFRSVIKKEN